MLKYGLISLCFIMTFISPAKSAASDTASYDWIYRPVYVFAPAEKTADLTQQIERFMKQAAEMTERNIVLVAVSDTADVRHGPAASLQPESLRKTYNIAPDSFTVVLVGKDTGVKRRHDGMIDPAIIFAQIDGMPMRRREMRQGQ